MNNMHNNRRILIYEIPNSNNCKKNNNKNK